MDWAEIIEWKFFNIFLFSVKIARKNTPKMMREASSVSVGYAIKMRQIQDEEEEEDDDDYWQRLRRRWEQCPITKPTPPPPSPSSSLRKWKSWVLSAKYSMFFLNWYERKSHYSAMEQDIQNPKKALNRAWSADFSCSFYVACQRIVFPPYHNKLSQCFLGKIPNL